VPYPCFFIYYTYHAHIMDTCLCLHICFYIEYNHSDKHGKICMQHPTFSAFSLPLHSYQANDYHLEIPYF
jgi:hypothetical protein